MTHITIRRATVQDIPRIIDLLLQVCDVHHQGRPDLFKKGARKYTDSELAEIIEDGNRPIFVATDGSGRVCGYTFCVIIRHENDNILTDVKTLYIDDLCIDEAMRGHHIGAALYEAAKSFAREIGCYNLTLNVWNCNPSAMKFYERQGLTPQKTTLETIL